MDERVAGEPVMGKASAPRPCPIVGEQPLGYQPALDGLRAAAIVLVVAFHTDRGGRLPLLPGGFLGVDVFFVLSGFLITSLLIDEWSGTGRIRLRAFWGRRVARLFPVLWALLAVHAFSKWVRPIAGLGPPSPYGFLALLGYVGNWVPATNHGSLFGLEYVWSLSVEEQFYVLWPLLVAGLLVLGTRRDRRRGTTLIAAVALTGAVTVMVLRAAVFSRTYFFFNTGLRCDGLLLGAVLAATRRWWQPRLSAATATALVAVSAVVLGMVVAVSGTLDPHLPTWQLPALELAVTGLSAGLVAVPTTVLARLTGTKVLVWLGRRSYALYLIHLPVFDVVSAHVSEQRLRLRAAIEIPVALVLAHFAHVLIELPAQRRLRRLLRAEHRPADHAPTGPLTATVR